MRVMKKTKDGKWVEVVKFNTKEGDILKFEEDEKKPSKKDQRRYSAETKVSLVAYFSFLWVQGMGKESLQQARISNLCLSWLQDETR